MNVLVIGNGGREHAIIQALKKSPRAEKIYAMKGNAGIGELAELVDVDYCDVKAVGEWVDAHPDVEYTVIAPDDPLALGLADELESRGHRVFGPNRRAAAIEASKAFSKNLMKKYKIPTAKYEIFDEYEKALAYVETSPLPVVLKADGLALGKGVLICATRKEAREGLKEIMLDKKFGEAGNKVVVEEFLEGPEVSVLAFTDGKTILPMVTSCDHKRAFDNDEGLNTGGMGTFSPAPFYGEKTAKEVMDKIMLPTMYAMNAEGRTFKGVLYFGLMKTKEGMKVIEYNSRFGDPETEVVLPRLKSDIYDIFSAVADGRDPGEAEWHDFATLGIVLASKGYPGSYEKGYEITGTEQVDGVVYHMGTAIKEGRLVTSGGRVMIVVCRGADPEQARCRALEEVRKIGCENLFYRSDIGMKALSFLVKK